MTQLHADAVVGSFDLGVLSVLVESSSSEISEVKLRFRSYASHNWTFVLNPQSQSLLEEIIQNFAKNAEASSYEEVAQLLHTEVERVFSSKPKELAVYNEHDFRLEDVAVELRGQSYHSRASLPRSKGVFEHAVQFTHTHHDEIGPVSYEHTHDVALKLLTDVDVSKVDGVSDRLAVVVDEFFSDKNNFDRTTLEDAGTRLFNTIARQAPDIPLWAVSLKIDYDGSLDHPTQTVDFVMSRA